MAKTWRHDDVDFEQLGRDLGKLTVPRLTVADVLERVRGPLIEQAAAGVTERQMLEVLERHGITISARTLRQFLASAAAQAERRRAGAGSEKPAQASGAGAAGESRDGL